MDRMQQQPIAMNMGLQLSSGLAKERDGGETQSVSACGHHKWLGAPHSLRNRIRKHNTRRKVYSVSMNVTVLFERDEESRPGCYEADAHRTNGSLAAENSDIIRNINEDIPYCSL